MKKEIKKILLINDMAGYGKVALSAMSPVLSSRKYEVFSLPTVVLSNTLNYGSFASLDTTEYMQEALKTWQELGFDFDVVATGFIANDKQAEFIGDFLEQQSKKGVMIVTDPIMADNGKLYNSITQHRIDAMKKIIAYANLIVPNITEACFLTGYDYREEGYEEKELYNIADILRALGTESVLITGAPMKAVNGKASTAVIGYDGNKGEYFKVQYEEMPVKVNGTGDIFSAVVIAEMLAGKSLEAAACRAVDKVVNEIKKNWDILPEYNGLPME